jgi:hypothetical protein
LEPTFAQFVKERKYLTNVTPATVWRVVVAVLAVASGLLGLVTISGAKIPWVSPFVLLVFVTPWLFWLATVSGPSFELVFPAEKASVERQIAERQFDVSQTPTDALNLDFKRLEEYYAINQLQARSSFRWAKFSMFIGFGTIVAGIWLFYFRVNQPDKFMTTLTTAAGCVVNMVSGLLLYLHSKAQDRSLQYCEPLARLQRLSVAMRLVEAHKGSSQQTEARNLVIRELLEGPRPPIAR